MVVVSAVIHFNVGGKGELKVIENVALYLGT